MAIEQIPVTVNPGWTWAATIGAVQAILIACLGGGGLWGIFRGVALLWKQNNESKKQEADIAAALRKEMAELNDRQQKRIDDLEKSGRDDRNKFDAEMAALRKQHADEMMAKDKRHEQEIVALRDEIRGLHRQIVQWQQSSGAALPIRARANTDASSVGDILRTAIPLPGGTPDDAG